MCSQIVDRKSTAPSSSDFCQRLPPRQAHGLSFREISYLELESINVIEFFDTPACKLHTIHYTQQLHYPLPKQCSAVQFSTVQFSSVQFSAV